jgi:hypothetical protein
MDAKASREKPLPAGRSKQSSRSAQPKSTNPNILEMTEEERHAKGFA